MSDQFNGAGEAFSALLKTVAQLRDPQKGCPWDLEQTAISLLPYLLEEAQEFMSVIENNQDEQIVEELGDVLFQVILHSQISFEKKLFTPELLCQKLTRKLKERHPHVFSDNAKSLTAEEVKNQWSKNKHKKSGLDKLHDAVKLAPILAADKIGSFSNHVGFDWENSEQVFLKVEEELEEVRSAMSDVNTTQKKEHLAEEIGDLLFSTIQLARHLNLSADYCLKKANDKFYQRFLKLDKLVKMQNKELIQLSLEEKELLWAKVKSDSL